MKVKKLELEEAIGSRLSHDLTQISPEKGFKGARFRRGHTLRTEDLPILRSMGKEHLSILEMEEGDVHEDDAAIRLSTSFRGENLSVRGPSEGKCTLYSDIDGLLSLDENSVNTVNEDPVWIMATLPNGSSVRSGEDVAALRILPLSTREEGVLRAIHAARPIRILPFRPLTVALVTTGREIAEGRIKDAFRPRLEKKISALGGTVNKQRVVTDDRNMIVNAIGSSLEEDVDLVVVTGGMSVDIDDVTADAIRDSSDEVIFQGIPVLPACNLMLARKKNTFIVGVPAGAVFENRTSLDLILPGIFAGQPPTFERVRKWGVGGFCRHCGECVFPACSFAARPL